MSIRRKENRLSFCFYENADGIVLRFLYTIDFQCIINKAQIYFCKFFFV